MLPHHEETIQKVKDHFEKDPRVQALLLTGSIAHGFESPESDVDIAIVLDEEAYAAQRATGTLTYLNMEIATYKGGYIDGKYISLSFLALVAEKGSEPARFAFHGAKILFSHIPDLPSALEAATRYPVEGKEQREKRFFAQFMAWGWYCGEAMKKENAYLLHLAVSKFVLFGGRLVLAHNEVLYPYHKWFLEVLERHAEKRPEGMVECIGRVLKEPGAENVKELYGMVKEFRDWGVDERSWGAYFMRDSELNWLDGHTPVDDL